MKTLKLFLQRTVIYFIGLLVMMVAIVIVGFLSRCVWEALMIGFNAL